MCFCFSFFYFSCPFSLFFSRFFFFLMIRRTPISTRSDPLFPYTTLFRSQLRGGGHGELQAPGVEPGGQLARRLADSGEDALAGRHAGGQRPPQLTLRDHVGAGTERGEGGDDRLVGVGLQRIADGRRQVGDRRGEVAVAVLQGVGVVAVERSADLGGQRIERHPGGMQPTGAENGRASSRERGWQYGKVPVVPVTLK